MGIDIVSKFFNKATVWFVDVDPIFSLIINLFQLTKMIYPLNLRNLWIIRFFRIKSCYRYPSWNTRVRTLQRAIDIVIDALFSWFEIDFEVHFKCINRCRYPSIILNIFSKSRQTLFLPEEISVPVFLWSSMYPSWNIWS